jgi:hypothetical protein
LELAPLCQSGSKNKIKSRNKRAAGPPKETVEKPHHAEACMNFDFGNYRYAYDSGIGPFGREPFFRLAALLLGRGGNPASSSRLASRKNDFPLGAPAFSTVSRRRAGGTEIRNPNF